MNDLPVEYLRECFDCDFETGVLTWRVRPREHFTVDRIWKKSNTQYAGKVAGSPSIEGYLLTRIAGREYKTHRIVFALYHGHWPVNSIDHIDQSRTNNAITNLRDVTNRQNHHNRKNNNAVVGICFCKHAQKLKVQIRLAGKKYYLGYYTNADDAAKVSRHAQSLIDNLETFKIFKALSTQEKINAATISSMAQI